MKPLVSIITPTYNHEKYIAQCIESALRQTYPYWEMIIIDDGSIDSTPDVIRVYDDPRIVYIRKGHRGLEFLGENYNEALERSRGDLILILEGDDYIPETRIERQIPVFEDKEIVLSHGRCVNVLDKKTVAYLSLFKSDVLRNQPVGSALKILLNGFNMIGTQSVMVRRSALLEIGGFTQPHYLPLVDYPTWMKLALKGCFNYIPEVLGYWRRHPLSVTMNKSDQIFNGFIRYCSEFSDSFGDDLNRLGLKKYVENRGAIAYLFLGMARLSRKEWNEASRLIEECWHRRETVSMPFKMVMSSALIGAYIHLDIPDYLMKIRRLIYQVETLN